MGLSFLTLDSKFHFSPRGTFFLVFGWGGGLAWGGGVRQITPTPPPRPPSRVVRQPWVRSSGGGLDPTQPNSPPPPALETTNRTVEAPYIGMMDRRR